MSHPIEEPTRGERPSVDDGSIYVKVQQTKDFQELRRRFRRFVFPMTVVFLSWYLLYVIASGWARDFMGHKLLGNINVAYVFGLAQFASTFLIAWLYERYMTRNVDPLADGVAADIKEIAR
jgi:uncharacterized membrane protein (DUF485 family)